MDPFQALLLLSLVSAALGAPQGAITIDHGNHGGMYNPDYTPEVKHAMKHHFNIFNTVEQGGLELLQAPQIASKYLEDTAEVAEARARFMDVFQQAELGEQAEAKGRSAIADIMADEPVAEPMAEPMAKVVAAKAMAPLVYGQPLVYQLPYHTYSYLPYYGR